MYCFYEKKMLFVSLTLYQWSAESAIKYFKQKASLSFSVIHQPLSLCDFNSVHEDAMFKVL